MENFTVFERSATNFEELANAEKIEIETGLSYNEAREMCQEFNSNRTNTQIDKGTKYEFTQE